MIIEYIIRTQMFFYILHNNKMFEMKTLNGADAPTTHV